MTYRGRRSKTRRVVIRYWCGRCHSEISGPAGECRVCAASAAEVARHHRITVQERYR